MGPMGGPMDFGRNKSKFQEVPETGITFDDVAVSFHSMQAIISGDRHHYLCFPWQPWILHFSGLWAHLFICLVHSCLLR